MGKSTALTTDLANHEDGFQPLQKRPAELKMIETQHSVVSQS